MVCPKAKLSPKGAGWLQWSFQLACCRTAPSPLHFSCLSSFVPSLCSVSPSWLFLLPSCPPPCLFVWFPAIWRPHWVPGATQPLGNSNRWGGTASLTDGLTEAGLLQQSSLGNQRQELSHHGCLLNRGGRDRASSQPQTVVLQNRVIVCPSPTFTQSSP